MQAYPFPNYDNRHFSLVPLVRNDRIDCSISYENKKIILDDFIKKTAHDIFEYETFGTIVNHQMIGWHWFFPNGLSDQIDEKYLFDRLDRFYKLMLYS